MKLSIIIPCYNEKNTIEQILYKIKNCQPSNKEIIVIDDYSTDGTRELLETKLKGLYDNLILNQSKTVKVFQLRMV